MPYLRDQVFVLKKEPYREHDRRYYLYGRDHGLLVAVARGASSKKSKQAGHLEPFTVAEVMVAKGASFDKLAVAKMTASYFVPGASYLAGYAVMGSFADLVIKLMRPGVSDERIFDLFHEAGSALAGLPREPSADRSRLILSAATLKLLDLLGFAPPVHPSPEFTTPVQSLALVSFMRRAPLADILRLTGQVDVFRAASAFVDESLKNTHLERQPRHAEMIYALLG